MSSIVESHKITDLLGQILLFMATQPSRSLKFRAQTCNLEDFDNTYLICIHSICWVSGN